MTVSVTTDGTPAVIGDRNLEISDDGRFVLFSSFSDSLVPGGTPNTEDFFLRDLQLGTTQQVSVTDTGAPAPVPPQIWPDETGLNRLSADGRFALLSTVTRLTASDTDVLHDIYRFDRLSGTTTLVSPDTSGTTPTAIHRTPSISGDGQQVLFQYFPGHFEPTQLVLRDMIAGTSTVLALPAMQSPTSVEQSLSRDASAVFFSGMQLPLANRLLQVFRFDIATSKLSRPSTAPAWSIGAYANGEVDRYTAPSVSADGRFVAFASVAENLVAGDTNGVFDVFVRDRLTGTSQRISLRADGTESTCASVEPSLSSDGRFVTFTSCGALASPASGTQNEIYRYDRVGGSLMLISVDSSGAQADSASFESDVSDDGQYVAFFSCARDLVAISGGNLCQHYLRDVAAGVTVLVSRSNSGEPATGNSYSASRLSANGRFVGYTSSASNLVAGDTSNHYDAFVFDRLTSTTERVSVSSSGQQGNHDSTFADFAQGGSIALLTSTATNFAAVGGSSVPRAYLRDRNAGTTTLIPTPGTPSISAVDPTISEDGRFVAMINRELNSGLSAFDDARRSKLYVLDRHDGQFRTLTWFPHKTTDTMTSLPQLSADGSHIAFLSTRDDLTDDDGNGGMTDVFITRINDAIFSDGFQ